MSPELSTIDVDLVPSEGYAILRWTITYQGRVTHMLVNACETNRGLLGCILNNIIVDISLSSALEVRVNITTGGSDYKFTVELYDGEDLIYSPTREHTKQDTGNIIKSQLRYEFVTKHIATWFDNRLLPSRAIKPR